MKKSIICLIAVAGMVMSCDPIKEEKGLDLYTVTASQIESAISFTQTDIDGNPASDGNYFTYTTNPDLNVTIYNLLSDGSENILARGLSGSFSIKPKRGSDPNQTFYVRVVGSDNNPVDVAKTYTVYVQQELDPEIRLLASDAYGEKIWKWDGSITGAVWGNMGYCGGAGADVGISGNGQWWGVTSTDEFNEQLQHSTDGVNWGDGDTDAYMVFDDEGILKTYDATGNIVRQGSYQVEDYNANGEWKVGNLITTAIMWPYEINSGANIPGIYEICYLTADKMTLVYPDGGDFGGLGGWGEATFWHFCSSTDVEGMAVGYGSDASKSWTWDGSITGAVWGNMGYCGGAGSDVGISGNGQWWGVTSTDEFNQQLQHSTDGVNWGDGDTDAYMTFDGQGILTAYDASGSQIRQSTYDFDTSVANDWKVANLNATAILWPYEINSGANIPGIYEVVYLTSDKMTLVYPDGGDFGGLGGWGEATFWHFKAK